MYQSGFQLRRRYWGHFSICQISARCNADSTLSYGLHTCRREIVSTMSVSGFSSIASAWSLLKAFLESLCSLSWIGHDGFAEKLVRARCSDLMNVRRHSRPTQ